MGLDISVGVLSRLVAEDEGGAEYFSVVLQNLNEVLSEAGLPLHVEPSDLSPDCWYDAQMWGYGGIHFVRRLAAHLLLTGQLPPPCDYDQASSDPVLLHVYGRYAEYLIGSPRLFGLGRKKVVQPRFAHLLLHSDAEGFYVPFELPQVIADMADEQRIGIGGSIGSSLALSREVQELCSLLSVPPDLDPESELVWNNAESPPATGALWEMFAVETFVLTRLREACRISQETGAAICFT